MTRLPAALIAALLLVLPRSFRAQDAAAPPPVVLDVVVSDANGAPARDLGPGDFEVLGDSRPQAIASFSTAAEPLTVVFLLDVSASAESLWRPDAAAMVAALGGALKPGERARLGGIAGHLTLGPWTTNSAELDRTAAATLTPSAEDRAGPSPLWDAVDGALTALATEPGRRTIVMLTDGLPTGNVHGVDEIRARAAALGITVNVVVSGAGLTFGAGQLLSALAASSGGLALEWRPPTGPVPNGAHLPAAMTSMAGYVTAVLGRVFDDLRTCYRIGFVPERADGREHAVSVRVRQPGYKVRTRDRYVAATGG